MYLHTVSLANMEKYTNYCFRKAVICVLLHLEQGKYNSVLLGKLITHKN